MNRLNLVLSAVVVLVATPAWAQSEQPYTQHKDVVYGQLHGTGLLMDIFEPTGTKNGLGIVDVASGAWHSDRGKIRDHSMARLFDIFCANGYVVFAVRPGSVTKYSGPEMLENLELGIRYAKAHADDYGIDPDRLGIVGASAGGHLALLALLSPKEGNATAKDPLHRFSTEVAAAGIFFPPTNFLDWDGEKRDLKPIQGLLFEDGFNGRPENEIEKRAQLISPYHLVTEKTPPILMFHGDADPLVPLQQSKIMVEKLKSVGTDVELVVKEGGGHPWFTIFEEVAILADWFDEQLGAE